MKTYQASNSTSGSYSVNAYNNSYGVVGKPSSRDYKAKALFSFIGLCIITLAFFFYHSTVNPEPDVCDPEQMPAAHYMTLLDNTDRLNDKTIKAFIDRLLDYVKIMKTGDWLSIAILKPNKGNVIKTYLQICKPKHGDDVNVMTENGKKTTANYQKNYVDVLNQAIVNLQEYAHSETANSSPLLRAIYEISEMPSFAPTIATRELLIMSDMVEHSVDICSFFSNQCELNNISDNFYIMPVTNQLANVKLKIIQLKNKYAHIQQKPNFKQFWGDYFMFAGVDLQDINQVVLTVKPDVKSITARTWVVRVATYQSLNLAEQLGKRLKSSGFKSFNKKNDQSYVVYVGPETCKRAATLARDLINRQYKVNGHVISI